ncbi:Putative elongation factor TypA-like svr3, chloroplastic [Trifolium repens]|nr:Putative elongation factor TypA-like svr3, chloroplastic [Trifolium repens]
MLFSSDRDLFPYNLKRIEPWLDIALLALNQGFLLNVLLFLIPRANAAYKIVLKKALEFGHAVVVVVNKIDRSSARSEFVANSTFELFIELNCDFQVIYASGIKGKAGLSPENLADDLGPLFESITRCIPKPRIGKNGSLQMLVSSCLFIIFLLGYKYRVRGTLRAGRITIGRLEAGVLEKGMEVKVVCTSEDSCRYARVGELYLYEKFFRVPAERVEAGDLYMCTITYLQLRLEQPTVKMAFSINTSPFFGREGKYVTDRNLRDELYRELERNLAMKVEDGETADTFIVSRHGTLHITILIENIGPEVMRIDLRLNEGPFSIQSEENRVVG